MVERKSFPVSVVTERFFPIVLESIMLPDDPLIASAPTREIEREAVPEEKAFPTGRTFDLDKTFAASLL